MKLAKQATGRPNVIVFQGRFHGRTHLTMAMTTSKTGVSRRVRAAAGRRVRGAVPRPFAGVDEATAVDRASPSCDLLLASPRPRPPRPRRS